MGKLAKPQRSTKHKKLKSVDPFYVGERPVERNLHRFNRKPVNDGTNKLSRGVHEIVKLKSAVQQRNRKSRKQKKTMPQQEAGVPEFKRHVGESEQAFLYRVDCETQAVIQQSQFDDKYNCDVDVLDADKPVGNTRREKRRLRLQKKREKVVAKRRQRRENGDSSGFDRLKDEVKFGEVVLQPPMLTARPRKSAATTTQDAQRRSQSLLLSKLFTDPTTAENKQESSSRARHRSMAERVMLDAERQRCIDLYRQLKAEKSLSVGHS